MTETNLDLQLDFERERLRLKTAAGPESSNVIKPNLAEPDDSFLDIRSLPNPNLGGDPTTVVSFTPRGQRILLEAGLSGIGAAIPGVGGGLAKLAARSAGGAIGGASGSGAAELVDPSENPIQSAAIAAGTGAAGEVAGAALVKFGGKLLRPFASKVKEGVPEANAILAEQGARLTPAQASKAPLVDISESVAEAGIISAGKIQSLREAAENGAVRATENFIDNFGVAGSREQTGDIILDAAENGLESFKSAARELYADVDRLAAGQTVNIEALQNTAAGLAQQSEKGLRSAATQRVTRKILELPTDIPFEDAQVLRSDLIRVGQAGNELVKGKAQGAAKQLAKGIDSAISDSATGLTPEALQAFRQANAVWKDGQAKFNNRFMRSLVNKDPELIFDTAIRNRRPSTIRRMRNIIDDPKQWRKIQGQWLENWFQTSVNAETGEVTGKALIGKLNQMGGDALGELFPGPTAMLKLKALAKTVQLAQSRPDFGMLKIGTQIAQAGVVFGVASGKLPNNAAAVILLPEAVAFILSSKTGFKLLTEGLKAIPGTPQATKFLAQFSAFLIKNNLIQRQESTAENFTGA